MMQLFGTKPEQEQDQRLAHDLAVSFGELLRNEPNSDLAVRAINATIKKFYEQDIQFAKIFLDELKKTYPDMEKKYGFKV